MFILEKLNRFSFFRAPWVGTLFGKSFRFSFFCADSSSLLFRKDVFCLDFVFPCIQRLKNDFDFRFSAQKAIYSVFQFHFRIPVPASISNSVSASAQAVRRRKIVMGGSNFVIPARRDNVAGSAFSFQFRFRFRFQHRGANDGRAAATQKCVGAAFGLRWSICAA